MDKKHLFIGLFIAGAALYLTFRNVALDELILSLKSIEYFYLVPAMGLGALSFVLRAYRWTFLVSSLKKTSTGRLMAPLCVGFMGNLLPARAGELIRAYLLGKKEGISVSASFATIFVERIFDMLSVLAMAVWLLLFQSSIFDGIAGFGGHSMIDLLKKFGWLSLALSLGIIIFSYSLVHWNEKMTAIIKVFLRPFPEKLGNKVLHLVDSFSTGLHILKDFKAIAMISLLSLVLWFVITFSYYPVYLAFGLNDLPPSSLVALTVIVCVFISLFPTPGFLGSFQVGCVVALHNIFHVPEAQAASFGMVTWTVQFGALIALGSFYLLKEGFSLKQLAHVKDEVDV